MGNGKVCLTGDEVLEWQALFWDALYQYVQVCGGNPYDNPFADNKQKAIREIEKLLNSQP